jgi:hypothetical protein
LGLFGLRLIGLRLGRLTLAALTRRAWLRLTLRRLVFEVAPAVWLLVVLAVVPSICFTRPFTILPRSSSVGPF